MKSTVEFDLSDKTHRAAMRAALDVLDGVTSDTAVQGAVEPVQAVTPEAAKRKKPGAGKVVLNPTPAEPSEVFPESTQVELPAHLAETPVQPVAETPVQPVAETTTASTISIEDVRKAVSSITIASPEKRPELVKLLGEYGAANVTSLDPKHYGAFVERLKSI